MEQLKTEVVKERNLKNTVAKVAPMMQTSLVLEGVVGSLDERNGVNLIRNGNN